MIGAMEAVSRMSEDEYLVMMEAQKESFIRAMATPCEHGVLDFETCPDCRLTERNNEHG